MTRVCVRKNGASSGYTMKIVANWTKEQLVAAAAEKLLTDPTELQRACDEAGKAKLYIGGGDVAEVDDLEKDDVVFVAFSGSPSKRRRTGADLDGTRAVDALQPAYRFSPLARSAESATATTAATAAVAAAEPAAEAPPSAPAAAAAVAAANAVAAAAAAAAVATAAAVEGEIVARRADISEEKDHWFSQGSSGLSQTATAPPGDAPSTFVWPTEVSYEQAKRTEFTNRQLACLWAQHRENSRPSKETRERLAAELSMSSRSVGTWFQNRRQRDPNRVRKPLYKPQPVVRPWVPGAMSGALRTAFCFPAVDPSHTATPRPSLPLQSKQTPRPMPPSSAHPTPPPHFSARPAASMLITADQTGDSAASCLVHPIASAVIPCQAQLASATTLAARPATGPYAGTSRPGPPEPNLAATTITGHGQPHAAARHVPAQPAAAIPIALSAPTLAQAVPRREMRRPQVASTPPKAPAPPINGTLASTLSATTCGTTVMPAELMAGRLGVVGAQQVGGRNQDSCHAVQLAQPAGTMSQGLTWSPIPLPCGVQWVPRSTSSAPFHPSALSAPPCIAAATYQYRQPSAAPQTPLLGGAASGLLMLSCSAEDAAAPAPKQQKVAPSQHPSAQHR